MKCLTGGALAVCMAGSLAAQAAEPSGTAIAVIQSTSIEGSAGQKALQAEAPVFSGDKIITGNIGEAQLRFRDNTRLVVGPNSSLVIDAFVFDAGGSARNIAITAVKGAFRFMTGTSRKDAYSINTPTATIGVRGTQFDISVEREGTTRIANYEGITRVCRRDATGAESACQEATDPCTLTVVRPGDGRVVKYGNDDIAFRNRQLDYHFRYFRSQASLRGDFQVDLSQCRVAAVTPGTPSEMRQPQPIQPGQPFEPPMPAPPAPPSVTLPSPPQLPGDRGGRTTYDHGSVFRR